MKYEQKLNSTEIWFVSFSPRLLPFLQNVISNGRKTGKKMKPNKFCGGKDEKEVEKKTEKKKSNKETSQMHSDTILIMLRTPIVE